MTNKLQEFNYFEEGPDLLIRNIATKVQGTQEIDDSLCQTGESSQQKLKCFVKELLELELELGKKAQDKMGSMTPAIGTHLQPLQNCLKSTRQIPNIPNQGR